MKRLIAVLLMIALFLVSYDLSFLILRQVKKTTWHEVLLRNGNILDGSGKAPYQGDILIRGEKIVAVGKNLAAKPGVRIIDAGGLYLLPGFVEMRSGGLPQGDEQKKWITSGVTTIIGGDRGSSPANLADYLKLLSEEEHFVNYGMLYGLGDLPLENPDLVPGFAAEAIKGGALGFSLDLEAFPDSWLNGEAFGGLFPDLSRGEKKTLLAVTFPEELAFQEELFLENLSKAFAAAGQSSLALHLRNFRLSSDASSEIVAVFKKELQEAAAEGIQVSGDINPFNLSGEPLYAWTARERFSPDELFLAKAGDEKSLLGRSLSELLDFRNIDPLDLVEFQFERQQESQKKEFADLPFFCYQPVYASSAGNSGELGEPMPYLRVFQEEEMLGTGSIEERVKKLAYLPAAFLGLEGRGLLSPGNYADLLVVKKESDSIILDYVFVNGKPVFAKGKFTGKTTGLFLSGSF